jgi:hypothetical protein
MNEHMGEADKCLKSNTDPSAISADVGLENENTNAGPAALEWT